MHHVGACFFGHAECVALLLSYGADLFAVNTANVPARSEVRDNILTVTTNNTSGTRSTHHRTAAGVGNKYSTTSNCQVLDLVSTAVCSNVPSVTITYSDKDELKQVD